MNFKDHSDLLGKHAFLSPSSYHWINYDDEKLALRFTSAMMAKRGTDLHEFAHQAIKLGIKMPKSRKTLHLYVNDGINYDMKVEQPLYYSENCFGHADTIAFRNHVLRIHDLKTGVRATSEHQLEVYAALFCLEYGFSPFEMSIELRIYQTDDVRKYYPSSEQISDLMVTIMNHDRIIEQLKEGSVW
jgi:hypothetical protein